MANYLKGIGDAATRMNEILPSLDARIYHFLTGHTAGIIKFEFNGFAADAIDRGVVVKSGMIQAHGYFGCSDTDTQINFVMPSTTTYVHLYAEIDLSVIPNRFEVKATPMSNSAAWAPRQDDLMSIPNGKYQLPLWQVTLTASTIILSDRRAYIDKPLNAVNAESGATQPQSDDSNRLATTSYVRRAVSDVKNIEYGSVAVSSGYAATRNTVKRQVNFVVIDFAVTFSGAPNSAVIGTVPEGFRPKSNITIGVNCGLSGLAAAMYPEQINVNGAVVGSIGTDGRITVNGMVLGAGTYVAVQANLSSPVLVNAGYEIT